ncbi:alpha/beta fold hydrolase [Corynebacterium felinum]|uniref:Pimeloyl-ACP methyl ester carboxylesterase n=1 Tax=Corynebacterium felinum TaxID=131318 RepID=A0ABU2BAV0_9CORY|nr:alpha/beta fold hydrolase [Corynebacterium felinum]MDF5821772.1 alpha/beta fold hydrolase [Corynebacterium felinum]MDR7355421.1 pimeloyl-ACP methyl ester carboxylesterase [Corynebacterium felinum]WJY94772.1 Putative non-heme bromoperoxidase BpoC [Corynebacterium felinum]
MPPSSEQFAIHIEGTGPLVVLVMGRGSPGRVWHPHQVPALTAAGYRVLTYDTRGTGATANHTGPLSIDMLVDDLAHIITDHGGRAFVVGTSLGARIALHFAAAHPDKVLGVVAAAAHGDLTAIQMSMSRHAADVYELLIPQHREFLAAMEAVRNLSPATLANPRAARDWLDLLTFSLTAPTSGARAQNNLDHGVDTHGSHQHATYATITAPTLAIAYGDDSVIPPAQVADTAATIPGCTMITIPNAGHYGYLEQPHAFNSAVIDFLNQHSA